LAAGHGVVRGFLHLLDVCVDTTAMPFSMKLVSPPDSVTTSRP